MYRALRIAPSRRACSAHSVGRKVQRISQFSISERYALGWLIGAKHTGSQPQAQYLRLTLIGLAPWARILRPFGANEHEKHRGVQQIRNIVQLHPSLSLLGVN